MKAWLPIDDVLPAIVAVLQKSSAVVVRAEPGAGKTTRVPPALLDASLAPGQVIVLEPRRVAARAVARRIAAERGVKLGGEVGYQVRHERVGGDSTRLWVVTEGVLTRRLLADPLLDGVGVVVLDEFHERSVNADLAAAFLREVLEVRDDLKVVVMSATLDHGPISAFLHDAPTIDCPGRVFPVVARFLPTNDVVEGVERGLHTLISDVDDDGGDVLVFMPGAREIEMTVSTLRPKFRQFEFLPLYGALSAAAQDHALAGGERRRVIVATNIAETSVTIPNVTAVIDSGLVRQLNASMSTGVDELVTEPISQASARQRAGRAGRTSAGRVIKLWSEADDFGKADYDLAQIHRVDLTGPVLAVACWNQIPGFRWFQAPPQARVDRAAELLSLLGAVSGGKATEFGRKLNSYPLHPRLAAMVEAGTSRGCARAVSELAAIIAEPDFVVRTLPGSAPAYSDILERAKVVRAAARGNTSPARHAGFEVHVGRAASVVRVIEGLQRGLPQDLDASTAQVLKACMAGFPDRIGLRRGNGYAFVGGGSATLARDSLLEGPEALMAHIVFGTSRDGDALIRAASCVEPEWLDEVFPGQVSSSHDVFFDEALERVVGRARRRFGALVLSEETASVRPQDDEQAAILLKDAVLRRIERGSLAAPLMRRLAFLSNHCHEVQLPSFLAEMDDFWLNLCWGRRNMREFGNIEALMLGSLTHVQRQTLDRHAPERLVVPSGSSIALDYSVDPPVLAVRLQEVFGWTSTPRIADGRVAVTMHLLAPNYRPAQITSDLGSFWTNTYPDVRRELRARYPKHAWPEDPLTAIAKRR